MIKTKVEGLEELNKALDGLEPKVGRKIIKKGINEGTKIVLKEMKDLVPVRTGTMRKSLGRKVKAYRKSQTVLGIVGPRKGFATEVDGRPYDPVNVAHLVENGHSGTEGKPFVRPAWDNTQQRVKNAFVTIAKKDIADYARRT